MLKIKIKEKEKRRREGGGRNFLGSVRSKNNSLYYHMISKIKRTIVFLVAGAGFFFQVGERPGNAFFLIVLVNEV